MRRLSVLCISLLCSSQREWAASSFGVASFSSSSPSTTTSPAPTTIQRRSARRCAPLAVALSATKTAMTAEEVDNESGTAANDSSSTSDDLSSFAASLEQDENVAVDEQKPKRPKQQREEKATTATTKKKPWQEDLEELLSPKTRLGERQAALQELLGANQDIRASVEKALKDRNIEPLLTPTGKKFQAGTRAVARQISSDILPSIAATARPGTSSSSSATSSSGRRSTAGGGIGVPPIIPPMTDLSKVGGRVFNALQNQFQKNVETLQGDLADPRRIPRRLSKQTSELVKEATNVFSETPVGLKEPKYTVVSKTDDYEIRDYEGYKVASTQMAVGDSPGDVYRFDNVALTGAAFNSLAAYLFGANRDSTVMEMTTPVTTTLGGEMRFYLSNDDDNIPEPLEQDESKSVYETDSISIEEIPPARLAVRRFTGFVTEGEVARQKEALLTALELDGVELDIPHGSTVSYVVFQYNPPYTLPVIRRNEIAVPVAGESSEVEEKLVKQSLEEPWDMSLGIDEGEDTSAEDNAE